MLTPLVKYPGGKEKELKHILPNLPKKIANYYEPFVGGGAVYFAISEKIHKKYINDKSVDLIRLYNAVMTQDKSFFALVNKMSQDWINLEKYASTASPLIWKKFNQLNTLVKSTDFFENEIILNNILSDFKRKQLIKDLLYSNLKRKVNYIYRQKENTDVTYDGFKDIIHTAYKSAAYMYYRYLYNLGEEWYHSEGERAALYLFLRQYAYSSMFRFSKQGKFNVPYGGLSYNNINLNTKLKYFTNKDLLTALKTTKITNLDFEDFLEKYPPQKDDFLFIDPPYDSEFSKYDNLSFDAAEQRRLADYLINRVNANWMIVIKDTELVRELYVDGKSTYNGQQIYINNFQKKYNVNFRNRNKQRTQHLLITNYLI